MRFDFKVQLFVLLYKSIFLIGKIGHIILAILVLISSVGILINKHLCQNELKSIALFFLLGLLRRTRLTQTTLLYLLLTDFFSLILPSIQGPD